MQYIWAIPLLPGLGAAINGLVGIRAFSRRTAGLLACSTMIASLALSLLAFWQLLGLPEDARSYDVVVAEWIPSIPSMTSAGARGALHVPWAFRLDPLAAMMLLVVTGVGTLIHIYSIAYMHDEPRGGVARFFCYLNLFCFFMLMLVLGSNVLVMFVGWEGVGLCSYLLIGYWYQKTSAADAGKKAFVTNRIGDWGFILGIFLMFWTFGTLDFAEIQHAAASMPIESAHFGVLSAIALLLFVGATGKSAQIPLFVWLPDAMEGPTPVSALIHAATMVTAGVYMLGRNAVLFSHAPMVLQIVAGVGVLTALMAATIGLVQYDIKRVLAYSTVSQLGYMFTAVGVGAFSAGAFHLMTHAFFKALLFLGSGSVIHAMGGEQDMRRMGALKQHLPVTFATMGIGALAIAGIPPLAGFFSKDEILFRAFEANKAIWLVALITAFMTAFYMSRLVAMTFYGAYRGPSWERDTAHGRSASPPSDAHPHRAWHGPHESPRAMTTPLLVLAAGAVLAGFVGIPAALGGSNAIERFLEPSFASHQAADVRLTPGATPAPASAAAESTSPASALGADHETHPSRGLELGLMAVSVLVALAGIGLAWTLYVAEPAASARLATRFAGAHRLLSRKYYVDEIYDATVVAGTMALGPPPVVVRSTGGRRLRERLELGDAVRVVDVRIDRSNRCRWPGECGGLATPERQLLDKAGADRPRAELRPADAVRRVRVRESVSGRAVTMSHYLSLLLFLPFAGALLVLCVPKRNVGAIRWLANGLALAGFLLSTPLWFWYNPRNPDFQLVERAPWIPSIGAEYFLGVDGISTLLILLTTLMGFIAVLSSWSAITERVKEYYFTLLVLQTGMLGAFMSLDFLLFFLFWEVMLVPMYFLIGIWGSANRLYSAIKFFLYTLAGSVVMLLGILALYFHNHSVTGVYSFDVTQLQKLAIPFDLQWWIFLAFFFGFAIKVPMFPFHTWLP